MSQPTLNLYIKPGCPWCLQATAWLRNEGYRYREIDVIADDAAFDEMKALSGQTFAPTLAIVDGENPGAPKKILADFGPEELEKFLKKEGIAPARG